MISWVYLILLHFLYEGNETGEGRESIAVISIFEEILPDCEKHILLECRRQKKSWLIEFSKLYSFYDKLFLCHGCIPKFAGCDWVGVVWWAETFTSIWASDTVGED